MKGDSPRPADEGKRSAMITCYFCTMGKSIQVDENSIVNIRLTLFLLYGTTFLGRAEPIQLVMCEKNSANFM